MPTSSPRRTRVTPRASGCAPASTPVAASSRTSRTRSSTAARTPRASRPGGFSSRVACRRSRGTASRPRATRRRPCTRTTSRAGTCARRASRRTCSRRRRTSISSRQTSASARLSIGGSRVTPVHGGAALAAAQALKEKLAGRSVADAARMLGPGEGIEVSAKFDATAADHGACAQAIEVAVDLETGAVRVVQAVLAVDVGQVINPVGLRGQLEGGFIYGLGMALFEDLALEDGRVRAANLGDYKLPTIADVPPLRIVHLSDGRGVGPYGARSAGELVNPGVPAAVANAVHDASGARVHTLPVTAERVWRVLRTG